MKPSSTNGSVLVYLVVLLLLFGVLGVIITSLFTTSTSSSATPNQVRRAYYVTESAMRYAFSELRNSDFDPDVINTLNNTKYSLSLTEKFEFDFNIFGPWFDANEAKNIPAGTGDTLTLKVPQGKLTDEWMAKNPNGLWAVNYDSIDLDVPTARNVASWSPIEGDDTLLTITLATGPDDFNVDQDDSICLAVRPTSDQTINDGENLYVAEEAKDFFPEYDGAINIKGFDYVYKRMVHEPANNWVKLENVTASAMPNVGAPSQIDVSSTDFIVLSPRNHIVIPTGIADAVTVSGTLENALNIYDLSAVKAMARKPDIDFNREDLDTALNPVATRSDFITVDNSEQNKTINIGSNVTGQSNFGAVWFNADKAIGGKQNVCQAGACEFGRGVRVFFTLDYSGTADGLTFALINATNNTTSSSGGDRNMGELLGYAGDSRKVADPTLTTDFLDVTGAGLSPPSPGLHPPKMALEFDTWTNNNTLNYCQGTTKLNSNRNDPFDSNRDAVQYVFWGFTSLAMPCRNYTLSGTPVADHPSYDDNRHDSGELDQPWPPFTTGGDVRSTPTVADDGTVYVGSDDGRLYAINPDGTLKWKTQPIGFVRSSPAIGNNGVVYVGTNNGWVYGFAKEATFPSDHQYSYSFPTGGAVQSSPVIGAGGKVYVGSDDAHFYGLAPNLAKEWEFHAAGPLSFGRPAISPDGSIIYVSNRIDSGSNGFWVYAINPAQREADPTGSAFPGANEWAFDIGDGAMYMPGVDPTTGTIYSDRSGNVLVAITPAGTQDWVFTSLGSDFDSTPVVNADGTVYFGADDSKLYAINPEDRNNGELFPTAREWTFQTGDVIDSTPAIAPDGTILALSDDGNLYAVNPDGTEKWRFPISVWTDPPLSSPTVDNEGVVYVGSTNDKLYAINNYAIPRNFKDKNVSSEGTYPNFTVADEPVTIDDTDGLNWLNGASSKGPWAVRLEVMRSHPTQYEYTLHAWIRQCDSSECGNIFGTFYADTRIEYTATPHLAQTIELTSTEHTKFGRFLFGFTGATGSTTTQSALIADFRLSFIRENDPQAGD